MTIFAPLTDQFPLSINTTAVIPIQFELYSAPSYAFGIGKMRFDTEQLPYGSAQFGFEARGVRGAGGFLTEPALRLSLSSAPVTVVPTVGTGVGFLFFTIEAEVLITLVLDTELTVEPFQLRSGAGSGGYLVDNGLAFESFSGPPVVINNFVYVVMQPWMTAWAGAYGIGTGDTINLSSTSMSDIVHVLRETLRLIPTVTSEADLTASLEAILQFPELLTIVYEAQVNDSFLTTATVVETPSAVLAVVDTIRMLATITPNISAEQFVAAAIVVRDYVYMVTEYNITDQVVLTDLARSAFDQIITALETLTLTDAVQHPLFVTAVVNDDFALAEAVDTDAVFEVILRDSLMFSLRLVLDGEGYVAYVMNTRNKAITEYQNYEFDSFAEINGQYFGVKSDGVYRLDGNTDDATPIDAFIRTGLHTLGSRLLKQVHNAYIGYTTTGELVLKVITTDAGTKRENWYKINARSATATTDNRFSISKGLKSVYWQFELANIDGADFEIDSLKVWPFELQRRK